MILFNHLKQSKIYSHKLEITTDHNTENYKYNITYKMHQTRKQNLIKKMDVTETEHCAFDSI